MNTMCEETRREANEKVDKKARESQVLEILSDGQERTARQVAYEMWQREFTNTAERNNASPRLTSLLEQRKVVVVGYVSGCNLLEVETFTGKDKCELVPNGLDMCKKILMKGEQMKI